MVHAQWFSLHFWMNQAISNVFPKLLETRPIGLIDAIELGLNSPSIVLINSPSIVLINSPSIVLQ